MRKIITQPVDEHNYIPFYNWFEREPETSYEIICYKNAQILLPYFDVYHIIDKEVDTNSESNDIILSKQKELDDYADANGLREFIDQEFFLKHQAGRHPYEYVMPMQAKEILEGNILFKPREEDYLRVKEEVEALGGNIVTINGRNLNPNKAHGRNNTLINEIKILLAHGFTILNCTIPSPGLPIDDENYQEIGHKCLDYSNNISYFLCSKAVISVGNAGAINNHLSTQANVVIIGHGGWIDNPQFGFNGFGIFQAKQKVYGNVWKENNISNLPSLVRSLEPPTNIKFFK